MRKDKNKISFKDALTQNIRMYKILLKRSPNLVIPQLLLVVWQALTPYVGIYLSARIINELAGEKNSETLKSLVLAALISAAVIALTKSLINMWAAVGSDTLYYDMTWMNSEKLLDMDFADFDNPETKKADDKLCENMTGGAWGVQRVPSHVSMAVSAVFRILGGAALTVSLFTLKVPADSKYVFLNSPVFIFVLLAVMLLIFLLAPMLENKGEQVFAKHSDDHNLANRLFSYFGLLGGYIELGPEVRIYNQERICDKYNRDKTSQFFSKGMFSRLAMGPTGVYSMLSAAVAVVFTGFVYSFVCLKALAGAFGVGSVTQYIASFTMVSGGVSELIRVLGSMKNNYPFLKIQLDFIDIPHSMYKGSLTVEKRMDRDYEIEFRDVSFKYPGSDTYALRHANMKFKIGERMAVVGQNGSGKTTFIKLLCRLYDPTEGEILLNGINIKKYSYKEYLNVFSVVFQDFDLLGFSLGENVASCTNYDPEKAADCLNKVGFGERLKKMPKGLETVLYKYTDKDGVEVSGGEAQKIALARALYKDSPFIILDEPTAALDPMAEAEIYSKFNEIIEDKTAVYISHRLSSCRFCDEIAVFDKGEVVQKGSHEDLLSDENGKYYELWHAQAQYYTEE